MLNILEKHIRFAGQELLLTNQRVMYWPGEKALVLSDLHVGKSAHFRKNGIPIPHGVFLRDLEKLQALTEHYRPRQIIINGDLLHAGFNSEVEIFCAWRREHAGMDVHLVKGNHDRMDFEQFKNLNLTSVQDTLPIGPIMMIHEFDGRISMPQITGHIHPGVVVRTPVKNYRLPAFVITESSILLPAFSDFTGKYIIQNHQQHECYVFGEQFITKL